MEKISILVPVYNEQDSLETLYGEILDGAKTKQIDFEIIFVDDGSSDHSWDKIQDLVSRDSRVGGIRFRRNFGKAAALSAGVAASHGELVVTMDADLQDDPSELGRFLDKLGEGFDVVSGWKKNRLDPWHKTIPSKFFNFLVSWLTRVRLHDHNCGFKAYRREVFDEVRLYGELHRFVPVLAASRGFKVAEIDVHHRKRSHGKSKYGVERFVKGLLDLLTVYFLTGYSQRPQHLLGTFGLASFAMGCLGVLYLSCYWVARQTHPDWNLPPLHERPALIYSMGALLFGGQLISIGVLAELMTAFQSDHRASFSIRQTTGAAATPPDKGSL